jgi:hypothetical protein
MAEATPAPAGSSAVASGDADAALASARAGLRWKRISLIFVTLVAVAFIAVSVLQIIPDVFGAWVHPLPPASPGSPARICAEGVKTLARALDRASASAGSPAFDEALKPEWNGAPTVEQACSRSSEGLDAWAALLRLRSAEQQLARRGGETPGPDYARDLATLQREVASHLPVDLR